VDSPGALQVNTVMRCPVRVHVATETRFGPPSPTSPASTPVQRGMWLAIVAASSPGFGCCRTGGSEVTADRVLGAEPPPDDEQPASTISVAAMATHLPMRMAGSMRPRSARAEDQPVSSAYSARPPSSRSACAATPESRACAASMSESM